MQERMPRDNGEDLDGIEVVSFVNGSGSEDGHHRVVVEEKAKWSPCVWIARAGLEFGHPRWAVLHRGNHSAISLTFSSPLPIQPKIPPSCRKNATIALAWPASHTESAPPIFREWSWGGGVSDLPPQAPSERGKRRCRWEPTITEARA